MRLKRYTTKDGKCKYSLIEHEKNGHVEDGIPYTENEFFVIKLKDKHAKAALQAYAKSVALADEQFATDVMSLAARAGENSKWCKEPD